MLDKLPSGSTLNESPSGNVDGSYVIEILHGLAHLVTTPKTAMNCFFVRLITACFCTALLANKTIPKTWFPNIDKHPSIKKNPSTTDLTITTGHVCLKPVILFIISLVFSSIEKVLNDANIMLFLLGTRILNRVIRYSHNSYS